MPVGLFFLTPRDVPSVAPALHLQLLQGPLMPLCSELLQTAWEGGSARAVITPFSAHWYCSPFEVILPPSLVARSHTHTYHRVQSHWQLCPRGPMGRWEWMGDKERR